MPISYKGPTPDGQPPPNDGLPPDRAQEALDDAARLLAAAAAEREREGQTPVVIVGGQVVSGALSDDTADALGEAARLLGAAAAADPEGTAARLMAAQQEFSGPPPRSGGPAGLAESGRFSILGFVLALVSAAGMALGITVLYKGMAVIMQTEGGFVALGGPYEIAHPAPEWVWMIPVSVLGLFLFGGINLASSARRWGISLVLFAWMGLFISLGWNFLRFGFNSPFGGGIEWGWAVPGILFWVMGLWPSLLVFTWFRTGFKSLIDRQPNRDARRTWRIPARSDTTGVYLAAQALGAVVGVMGGALAFGAVTG